MDNIAGINSSGYFNDAANTLDVYGLIIVCDTAKPSAQFCTVISNNR